MEQALAYVCCSAEESRVKVQKYCRKIYELGYVPICPRFVFSPFLEESDAEDMQGYGRMSHILLRRCRMVVVCGKEVTGTMNTEISMADRLHIICTTLDGLVQKNQNKSESSQSGATETGGTRFASIAFGYPNALWGEPQSPGHRRKWKGRIKSC